MWDIPTWGNYIGHLSGFIALLLSLYNWKKSLVKIRVEIELLPLNHGCWSINALVVNDSSRSVSVLKTHVQSGNRILNAIKPTLSKGMYLYMHNGINVAHSRELILLPTTFQAYEAKQLELVIYEDPTTNKSHFVIVANGKKYKTKMPPPI